jgi:hypothetical protein
MSDDTKQSPLGVTDHHLETRTEQQQEVENPSQTHASKLVRFYANPWTQILLISFICFCLPGVSNLFS